MRSLCVVAATLIMAFAVPVACAEDRVRLLSTIVTHNDVVNCAELLPADAPSMLRELSAAISIGRAPAPGKTAQLTRANVEKILRGRGDFGEFLEIPIAISITRWARSVTPQDVVAPLAE